MPTLGSELQRLVPDLRATPRVYVDANMPRGVVAAMRQRLGWDVFFVLEEPAERRAPDARHFAHALELERTLITLDHDFLDARRFPPALSPGVIVCTAPDERGLLRILEHVDAQLRAADAPLPLRGRTLQLTMSDVVA
jgi:hypothetical protein